MAAASLLALIDDIAGVLDDVALLSKLAAKKTAGVLGDDLALNAQQVSGVVAERELPVVWAVARGSLVNKAILVPAALAISAFAPWAVTPLLMAGGAFLCYEGSEKLAHKLLHVGGQAAKQPAAAVPAAVVCGAAPAGVADVEAAQIGARPTEAGPIDSGPFDAAALERRKIRGAVRTDFILSAEIVAITLDSVARAPLPTQVLVLSGIALAMTVGVYGLVGGIVKLDDLGLWLGRRPALLSQALGRCVLAAAPALMKALGIAGTAAMFLVGGGIVLHGVPAWQQAVQDWAGGRGGLTSALAPALAGALLGMAVGAALLALLTLWQRRGGAARN